MFVGTPFQQVGGVDNMTFADLSVNCSEDGSAADVGWSANSDAVVMLDAYGSFVRKLVYIPQWLATDAGFPVKGWYADTDIENDDFTKPYNSTPIPFGSAFQVSVTGAGAKFTFAGQVKDTATIIDVNGFMGVANCACKPLSIGSLKVNCSEDGTAADVGWSANSDAVVILDEYGSFVRKLVYIPEWLATDAGFPQKGWYADTDIENDDFTKCYNDQVTWQGGDGFQVSVTGADATIQIDSAL